MEATNTGNSSPPVKHLVVDTGAILAPTSIHEIAEKYYAPIEVFHEVRSRRARIKLDTLPYEIIYRQPSAAAMQRVADEAKKTGDYKSLSLPDMKVIGLAWDLHQQYNHGVEAIPEESDESKALTEKMRTLMAEGEKEGEEKIEEEENKEEEASTLPSGFCENDVDSSDEEGWITENNLNDALKKMGAVEVEGDTLTGCISTDFALQNVLISLGIPLVSLSGYRITKLKSYVLRCRACYSTTTNMEKEFCPKCGNKSLHKCAVSVNEKGEQVLHINWRRMAVLKGLKYSLPAPKGGKHVVQEKLFEDQRMPQNKPAKMRTDPLDDSPFAMHDVTSRAAMLGIHAENGGARRRGNPNAGRSGRGTKRGGKK